MSKSHSHRNHLMSKPKNTQGTRRQYAAIYPCWCGRTLVHRYRMLVECCGNTLIEIRPLVHQLNLAVDAPPQEYLHTLRRADGAEIGGDFSFYVATGPDDWESAEADADDLWDQRDYVHETWVLLRRQVRTLGPEPLEEEDDDEPGADQASV